MKSVKCLFIVVLSLMVFSVFGQIGSPFGVTWNSIGQSDGNTFGVAEADTLYTAVDNDYVYFRATNVSVDDWGAPGMTYVFLLNTNDAAGNPIGEKSVWNREIYYDHDPPVDTLIVGQFGGGWASINQWGHNGSTAWDDDSRVYYGESGAPGGEWANANMDDYRYVAGNRLEVQVRFPKTLIGSPATVDVQYYITGNEDEHGSFDSIPADEVAGGWNPPASVSNLSNYEEGVSRITDWTLY